MKLKLSSEVLVVSQEMCYVNDLMALIYFFFRFKVKYRFRRIAFLCVISLW